MVDVSTTCRMCGATMRPADHVVAVPGSVERVVHVACAEAAVDDAAEWSHTDPMTLTEWARGISWGSSA